MEMSLVKKLVFGIVACFAVFHCRVAADDVEHWRYLGIYGVNNWTFISATCNAANHVRQSPINIVQTDATYDSTLSPISLTVTKAANDAVTVVNNGHTVSFSYNLSAIRVSGGHLNDTFRIAAIHFHWGSAGTEGSEHRIDGNQFLMEMHMVTFDETRYPGGVLDASGGANSIAVLSTLFTLSANDNPAFQPLLSHFNAVNIEGNTTTIPFFDPGPLLPSNTSLYFRYLGSLTTPPCSENVIWTVFKTLQTISANQMNAFRSLQELVEADGIIDYLSNNWRPVEPLDGRMVTSSFPTTASTAAITAATTAVSSVAAAALALTVLFTLIAP